MSTKWKNLPPIRRENFLLLLGLAFIVLLLSVPFRVPFSVKTTGKVLPGREYLIVRLQDGSLATQLVNHAAGVTEEASAIQVQRGDAQQFRIDPRVLAGETIVRGDTLAVVVSPDLEQAISQLEGQLVQARASLLSFSTGEKASLIEEASRQIDQARIQAEEQQRVVQRLRELLSGNLTSSQEYELALASQRVFEVNIAIAEARLASLQSGAKPEELAILRSQIASLEREIGILHTKAAGYVLLSPVEGIRLLHIGSDTLLSIASQDTFIVAMLVNHRDRLALSKGLDINITGPEGEAVMAKIHHISQAGGNLNGDQLFWVMAKMAPAPWFYSGLHVRCRILCPALTKRQFLNRFLK